MTAAAPRISLALLALAGLLFGATTLVGCDEAWLSCEDVAGMLESDAGLEVTEAEHPTGWAQAECMTCHSGESTHQRNCTDMDEVDLLAIQEDVEVNGDDSCAACHGENGAGR
jgi:hypothetical protein